MSWSVPIIRKLLETPCDFVGAESRSEKGWILTHIKVTNSSLERDYRRYGHLAYEFKKNSFVGAESMERRVELRTSNSRYNPG